MLVVTNYPNVPIATTNVATDSARVDNQQRPPVIPPQPMTKGHEERAFNPQHERTAEQTQTQAKLRDTIQGKQEGGSRQQDSQHQQQGKKSHSLNLKLLSDRRPALRRNDIKLAVSHSHHDKSSAAKEASHPMPNESPQFYQAFGERIGEFYQQQTHPVTEPAMTDSA